MTIETPVTETTFAGKRAFFLEANYSGTSPLDGRRALANNRWWTVPLQSDVVLIFAQQPVPPDSECAAQLEATIQSVTIR
jgi:hypothetical protein